MTISFSKQEIENAAINLLDYNGDDISKEDVAKSIELNERTAFFSKSEQRKMTERIWKRICKNKLKK